MLAAAAFVAGLIAGVLQLTGGHQVTEKWLIILAVVLTAAEVAWGWNRTGRYGRGGT